VCAVKLVSEPFTTRGPSSAVVWPTPPSRSDGTWLLPPEDARPKQRQRGGAHLRSDCARVRDGAAQDRQTGIDDQVAPGDTATVPWTAELETLASTKVPA